MFINVVQKSKYFSKEADIVLLCLTHEHGYGNWQKIKHALKRDTRCRFDHLFMSRTVQELQKRVDILVKSLEKEIQDTKNGILVNGMPVNKRNIKKRESMKVDKAAASDEDMALGDRAEVVPDIQMIEATTPNEDNDGEMVIDRELAAEMNCRLGDDEGVADEALYERAAPAGGVENAENGESDLAGKKRVREISEEEEDMDFDAIQQQTGQANI